MSKLLTGISFFLFGVLSAVAVSSFFFVNEELSMEQDQHLIGSLSDDLQELQDEHLARKRYLGRVLNALSTKIGGDGRGSGAFVPERRRLRVTIDLLNILLAEGNNSILTLHEDYSAIRQVLQHRLPKVEKQIVFILQIVPYLLLALIFMVCVLSILAILKTKSCLSA